jgi:hypothetical protein
LIYNGILVCRTEPPSSPYIHTSVLLSIENSISNYIRFFVADEGNTEEERPQRDSSSDRKKIGRNGKQGNKEMECEIEIDYVPVLMN